MISRILLKVSLLFSLTFLLVVVFTTAILSKYKLSIDEFYGRLTKQHNCGIVLGTSRAAHCLDPGYLRGVDYNFSFTLGHSPYDLAYMKTVKNYCRSELMQFDSNRRFILTVDPWVMSTYESDSFELKNNTFMEDLRRNTILNCINYTTKYIDLTPKSIFSILLKADFPKYFTLSENGRLILAMEKKKAQSKERTRVQQTIDGYKNKKVFTEGFYSSKRFKVLEEITEYLQKMGKVYYVRLPTSKLLFEVENQRWTDFNHVMNNFGKKSNTRYLNLGNLSKNVITIDGNHIWNGHSKWISKSLNDSLNVL